MKQVIIAAAGHVDHGKTALVRALTGVDTDRLIEEKQRGLTTDLGFAQLELAEEVCAGVIDVPGHEKFIRNMLAGAGAVDVALMTVAADEGVMPQTREHLQILSLLGARRGVTALTKCDLADAETRALARMELAECFAGTFLEHAAVVEVSARTGEGLNALRAALLEAAREVPARLADRPFWMPVDRVFTVDGFGTVVTGTVWDGTLEAGGELEISPIGIRARVRGLQCGGVPVSRVTPGMRAAVNLAGIRRETLERGCVLSEIPACTELLDVRLSVISDTGRTVANNQRLHFAAGAAETLCRVRLLDGQALSRGESGFVQLRLERPAAVRPGDRFTVRFYSPPETIGGGIALDTGAVRHRRADAATLSRLAAYSAGTARARLLCDVSEALRTQKELRARMPQFSEAEFFSARDDLLADGGALTCGEYLLSPGLLEARRTVLLEGLAAYHAAHPLEDGMPLELVREIAPDALTDFFAREGTVKRTSRTVSMPAFSVRETPLFQAYGERLLAVYNEAGFAPPEDAEAVRLAEIPPAAAARTAAVLEEGGLLVRLGPDRRILAQAYRAARETAAREIAAHGSMTLAQFRDALGSSRKAAQILLEQFDAVGYTKNSGGARTIF